MPELMISREKVAFPIEKAREFDAKELEADPDSGSNGADDEMIDVLTDNGRDPVQRELTGFINHGGRADRPRGADAAGTRRRYARGMEGIAARGRGRSQRPHRELPAKAR